jgi:hypothetical protein
MTIERFRGGFHRQLSVFSAPANNWVVNNTHFQFSGGLKNN